MAEMLKLSELELDFVLLDQTWLYTYSRLYYIHTLNTKSHSYPATQSLISKIYSNLATQSLIPIIQTIIK
jgi:hypothetical protein